MDKLVVGTRGSKLSLAQTKIVTDRISQMLPGLEIETKTIKTYGDVHKETNLDKMEHDGVFVKEIDRRMLDGSIDIAVHSLKDVPTVQPRGIILGAMVERADPRDVLISRDGEGLAGLRKNARVGTSSIRRRGQLLAYRSDLDVIGIRGNVEGRIAKLASGEYDAIVIAAAGVDRLGLSDKITERIPYNIMLPAPGQGILTVAVREEDKEIRGIVARLDDRRTRIAAEAERTVLSRLGGGCDVLLGALAKVRAGRLRLDARMTSEDGRRTYNYAQSWDARLHEEASLVLAEKILMGSAAGLVYGDRSRSSLAGKKVLVTRQEPPGEGLYNLLLERSAIPIYFPTIKSIAPDGKGTREPAVDVGAFDAIIITSRRSVPYLGRLAAESPHGKQGMAAKVVAIGSETRKSLEENGFPVCAMPPTPGTESVLSVIRGMKSRKVLLVNSAKAPNDLVEALERAGVAVTRLSPYTVTQAYASTQRKKAILGYALDFVTFASPSSVEGFFGIMGSRANSILSKSNVICIGRTTEGACRKMGVHVSGVANPSTIEGMVSFMENAQGLR